jgi:hypothetical protein
MNGRTVDNALTREELDHLKPSTEELFENTWRAMTWYNEAPYTAAALFVEACEKSDEFREAFVNEEMTEVRVSQTSDKMVESQRWREIIDDECPDVADRLWGIGLSSFQGRAGEQIAREYLNE